MFPEMIILQNFLHWQQPVKFRMCSGLRGKHIKDQVGQGLLMDISEDLKGQNYERRCRYGKTLLSKLMMDNPL